MDENLIVISEKNIYKVDSDGAKIDTITVTENINDVKASGDIMYVLVDHALLEYNANFELINTIFTSQVITLKKLQQKDNDYNYIGEKNNQLFIIRTQFLNILDTIVYPNYFKSFPELHLINSNQLIMAGNSNSDQVGVISLNIDSLPLSNDSLPDIKLKNYFTSNYSLTPTSIEFNATITVENVGKVPSNSFAIFAKLSGVLSMNCFQNYYYSKFDTVNILPNDTFQLVIKNISQDIVYNPNLCFEVLSPNSTLELNTDDNQLYKPFKLSADNKVLSQFKVYPNPFTTHVYVDLGNNNSGVIEVFDPVGKKVAQYRVTSFNQYLNLANLPVGIYYFRIQSENDLVTISVVKK